MLLWGTELCPCQPSIDQIQAELDRSLFWPDVAPVRPNLVDFGPNSTDVAQTLANFGQIWTLPLPNSADDAPSLVEVGRLRPNATRCGQIGATSCRKRTGVCRAKRRSNSGQLLSDARRIRPNSAKLGALRANFGRSRLYLGRLRSNSGRTRSKLGHFSDPIKEKMSGLPQSRCTGSSTCSRD